MLERLLSTSSIQSPMARGLERDQERNGCLQARQKGISGAFIQPVLALVQWAERYSRDPEQTRKLYEKYQPTHVIHLAALGEIASIYRIYCTLYSNADILSWWFVQEYEV